MNLKGLIPYALAFVAVGGVAVAQQTYGQLSPSEQIELSAESESPRRLTISVSVSDPEDLKVKEGDRVEPGQLGVRVAAEPKRTLSNDRFLYQLNPSGKRELKALISRYYFVYQLK